MWHVECNINICAIVDFVADVEKFCSQALTVTKILLSRLCMTLLIFPSIQHILFKSNFCLKIQY